MFAQTSPDLVRGVIMEESSNGRLSPLEFVHVFWEGATQGVYTDSTGYFEIGLSPETRDLVVSYVGYDPDTITVGSELYMSITLSGYTTLDEVQVVYRKRTTEVSFLDPLLVQSISQDELFKAACCNLSESFETNASVDVSFSDAITGAKEIQMLGLAGKYTMISREFMPGIRGMAIPYGLLYTPGTWIQSMQVTKGAGSVVNGYESIAGQINVELQKPEDGIPIFLNAFVNEATRLELNATTSLEISPKVKTAILAHGSVYPKVFDHNHDGFADQPEGELYTFINRWKFDNQKGYRGQLGIKYTTDDKTGGQLGFVEDQQPDAYGVQRRTERVEFWGKSGFIFPNKRYQSIGVQWSLLRHHQEMQFGSRPYVGTQHTGYLNVLYQSIIGTTDHKFKVGGSLLYDKFDEAADAMAWVREETVPGMFFEYTYTHLDRFTGVFGIRADHNSIYGLKVTPRAHLRYALGEKTVLRASAGKGYRSANVIAENLSLLATSRTLVFSEPDERYPFGLKMESAWNVGGSLSQEFLLDYRPGMIIVDFFRTTFQDQVIVDLDVHPQQAVFRNLTGKSYSNSFQAEVAYELLKRFDIKAAYRLLDVKTDYAAGLLEAPLVARHRGFFNMAYTTSRSRAGHWVFDMTLQWTGAKRLPTTAANPEGLQLSTYSPSFTTIHAQVTRKFGRHLDVYLGSENLTDFRQDHAILAADDPFGPYFDSSIVWGPIFGRKIYLGVRYLIQQEPE
ncbi:MAG: TonB-dependent receptor [Saprospiraceae bacterium]|nr:TonB-dependent receptor [Saprospiraceae bacterium]